MRPLMTCLWFDGQAEIDDSGVGEGQEMKLSKRVFWRDYWE